ncbi:GM11690 [Drosophila sechellia]|uniref:GM11690 n=1 Tax=Drosophila sechellia TaxID=7238 RepID=B4IL12_DROSE|nr:GM11690 [Drosophila sechellia]
MDAPNPVSGLKQHTQAVKVSQWKMPREKRSIPSRLQVKTAEQITAQPAGIKSSVDPDTWTKAKTRKKARLSRRPYATIVEAKGKTYSDYISIVTSIVG